MSLVVRTQIDHYLLSDGLQQVGLPRCRHQCLRRRPQSFIRSCLRNFCDPSPNHAKASPRLWLIRWTVKDRPTQLQSHQPPVTLGRFLYDFGDRLQSVESMCILGSSYAWQFNGDDCHGVGVSYVNYEEVFCICNVSTKFRWIDVCCWYIVHLQLSSVGSSGLIK